MKGERVRIEDRLILTLESHTANETKILDGLFDTLVDADECVVMARRGVEVVIYGGAISDDAKETLLYSVKAFMETGVEQINQPTGDRS